MTKIHMMDDKDLVRLYQQGNQQAITELVHRYKQRIHSTIYFLVKESGAGGRSVSGDIH
jgi:hypothetical protein